MRYVMELVTLFRKRPGSAIRSAVQSTVNGVERLGLRAAVVGFLHKQALAYYELPLMRVFQVAHPAQEQQLSRKAVTQACMLMELD